MKSCKVCNTPIASAASARKYCSERCQYVQKTRIRTGKINHVPREYARPLREVAIIKGNVATARIRVIRKDAPEYVTLTVDADVLDDARIADRGWYFNNHNRQVVAYIKKDGVKIGHIRLADLLIPRASNQVHVLADPLDLRRSHIRLCVDPAQHRLCDGLISIEDGVAHIRIYNKMGEPHIMILDEDDYSKHRDLRVQAVQDGAGKYWYGRTLKSDLAPITAFHRLLMEAPDGLVVDHINGETLDNRRRNLRLCTVPQNVVNTHHLDPRNKTGFTGVALDRRGRPHTYFSIDGKQRRWGPFRSIEEAARFRRELELKHWGEFAPRNQKKKAA